MRAWPLPGFNSTTVTSPAAVVARSVYKHQRVRIAQILRQLRRELLRDDHFDAGIRWVQLQSFGNLPANAIIAAQGIAAGQQQLAVVHCGVRCTCHSRSLYNAAAPRGAAALITSSA